MGNKMRKLICALLTAAMLVGSMGVVGFADTDTTDGLTSTEATQAPADETEATEAPADETEATEAPADETEATEAPAEATAAPATQAPVTSSSYDSDSYYNKALSLCSALGIISGYEDGSVKPDSKVTRAEMASIVLRMLNITSTSTYQNGFTDVTSEHWAADQIQTAQDAKIISGMGDGRFVPDGEVTYAQICVMLVNAMNYQDDAEYYGGYPTGYLKVAGEADLELTKNAPGSANVASDRGVVIKMVYNALLGQYKEIDSYNNGAPTYKAKGTLAKSKFSVLDAKGVLTATSKTSISSTELQDNEIEIKNEDDELHVFDCSLTGLEEFLAQKVTYYYKENSGLTPEVLAVTYDSSKTTTFDADADDIEAVEGFENGVGTYKIDGVNRKKDCADADIIYNGKVLTKAQIEELGDEINDLLLPEVGTIKLVDSDKDDVFDVVFVDSYETMVVSSAGETRLTGKIAADSSEKVGQTVALSLNLDDSIDRVVTVTKEGTEVKLRNLKKNDVASIRRSIDNSVVDIIVTGESITGTATGMSTKYNASYATINGERYDVANVAVNDLKTGSQSIFYTDMFGRIAYIEGSTAGRLASGEKYAWIMDGYMSEDGEDYLVQLYTQDGKDVEYKLGESLDYWAPTASESTTLRGKDNITSTVQNLIDNSEYIKTSGSKEVRLVKFKANSNNTISRLYCAVATTKALESTDALIVNTTTLKNVATVGGAVSGYMIADGIVEFNVPSEVSDMKDSGNYKFAEVTSSAYVVRENGSTRDYIVAEFDNSINVGMVINFTASANAAAAMTDMDSAGAGPQAMVIDEIETGVDEDDNPIYTINGYIGGTEVTVTTNKNTNVGKLTSSLWTGTNNGRNFDAPTIWNAVDSQYDNVDLTQLLKKGDLILYTSDGKLIAQYSSANDFAAYVQDGAAYSLPMGARANKSTSRVSFYFGKLEEADLSDTAWLKMESLSDNVLFDPSKLMDVVTISKNGKVDIDTEGATVSDLIPFDEETKTGDYVHVSTANKGDINNIVIYRFEG